jgi:holo-[acyl-carrier protein] synthase
VCGISGVMSETALDASAHEVAGHVGAAPGAAAAGAAGGGQVVGVGVDAVDVARFRRVLARRPGFAARFFTEAEQADAGRSPDPSESLAARFAAKEAVMKALGTGLGGFALTDVEVRRAVAVGPTRNAPSVVLHGAAARLADERGAGRFHLSLSHTTEVAIAFVVAERHAPCFPSCPGTRCVRQTPLHSRA